MSVKADEIRDEQSVYDAALDDREARRTNSLRPPTGAARPQDAAWIRQGNLRLEEEMPSESEPVFEGRMEIDGREGLPVRYYVGKWRAVAGAAGQVISWKARAAIPYFEATAQHRMGVISKREFRVSRHRIDDYSDVVFRDLKKRLEDLQEGQQPEFEPSDVLLSELQAGRSGQMREIAMTIGASQNKLIRSPLGQLLLIQGGPGTGKSAVALHRVSYWMFSERNSPLRADEVLMVGPNPAFIKYIRGVLPSLGDSDVAYHDLKTLGPTSSNSRSEAPAEARIKGEERMADLLHRALWNRVGLADESDLLVGPEGNRERIPAADSKQKLDELRSGSYRAGREQFRNWVESRLDARRLLSTDAVVAAVDRMWPNPSPRAFLQELLASINQLLSAAGNEFTAEDVRLLNRRAAARMADETWSDSDVALLDEIEWLMTADARTFRHVVVDEAQDLSPMQLRSLRRRSADGSMTIVGDIAQSTGAFARDTWDDLLASLTQVHPANVVELELGYRVPRQVFEYAAQILPYAAPAVTAPRVIRDGPEPDLIHVPERDLMTAVAQAAREHAGRGDFVGIICPESLRPSLEEVLTAAHMRHADGDSGLLSQSINVLGPTAAKGLEFDSVIVVEPEALVASDRHGLRLLYIALTRTIAQLTIVHSGSPLPLPQDEPEDPEGPLTNVVPIDPDVLLAQTEMDGEATGPAQEPEQESPPGADAPTETALESGPDRPGPDPTHPPASGKVASGSAMRLADKLSDAAAETLADEIRGAFASESWVRVVDKVRRQLGISDEEMFEQF